MRTAISLRMFPDDMSTLHRVEMARDAGFEAVEVNLEPWQEYSLDTEHSELARLRRGIEARGMRVSAVYDREQWHFPMSSRDPGTREHCQLIVERLAQAAVTLGADTVLIMPGAVDNSILAPRPEIVPYAEAYRNSQEVLRRVAQTAGEKYHVHLAAENCPGKFLITPLEFSRFLDEIDSEWVSACFDIGNALWYGYPEHWIPVLGARIWRIHVKDNRVMGGGAIAPAPLLAGDVNWPLVRDAIAEIRYDSWMTAEVLPGFRYHGERLIFETSASMAAIFGPGGR
ncbi:MAG: sugar phosphate isomerase/epimerase family protein [Spirochaetia bacterium]